jgi:pimeloyl-ACP methyl ester carboxylesterase
MRIAANPGDEAVSIPANGFNLGATLTRPSGASGKLPALILIGDTEDRDGTVFGVAVMAQVASAAANAGFLAVRYDRRGSGQSGGRPESATIPDLAEDVRAIARWLGDRKDIDPKRIAVLGHGQGAWVAQLASARERKIAALITVNSPSTTGADLALEQQQRMLDRLQLSASERERRVSLQKQIQNAVLTGKGWEGIPPDVRRQSDTAWTQSVLAFNPAVALDDVRQPMLLVHAELDRQVPASHVEHLAELARKESRSKSIDVVTVKGVNHLLVPAITGEEDEYATLGDPNVSKDVTGAVTTWLSRTLGPASRQ